LIMFGVGHLNQLAGFMDLGKRLKKADAAICQATAEKIGGIGSR
jgi:hypothetical protein